MTIVNDRIKKQIIADLLRDNKPAVNDAKSREAELARTWVFLVSNLRAAVKEGSVPKVGPFSTPASSVPMFTRISQRIEPLLSKKRTDDLVLPSAKNLELVKRSIDKLVATEGPELLKDLEIVFRAYSRTLPKSDTATAAKRFIFTFLCASDPFDGHGGESSLDRAIRFERQLEDGVDSRQLKAELEKATDFLSILNQINIGKAEEQSLDVESADDGPRPNADPKAASGAGLAFRERDYVKEFGPLNDGNTEKRDVSSLRALWERHGGPGHKKTSTAKDDIGVHPDEEEGHTEKRDVGNLRALWARHGYIDSMGSDHAAKVVASDSASSIGDAPTVRATRPNLSRPAIDDDGEAPTEVVKRGTLSFLGDGGNAAPLSGFALLHHNPGIEDEFPEQVHPILQGVAETGGNTRSPVRTQSGSIRRGRTGTNVAIKRQESWTTDVHNEDDPHGEAETVAIKNWRGGSGHHRRPSVRKFTKSGVVEGLSPDSRIDANIQQVLAEAKQAMDNGGMLGMKHTPNHKDPVTEGKSRDTKISSGRKTSSSSSRRSSRLTRLTPYFKIVAGSFYPEQEASINEMRDYYRLYLDDFRAAVNENIAIANVAERNLRWALEAMPLPLHSLWSFYAPDEGDPEPQALSVDQAVSRLRTFATRNRGVEGNAALAQDLELQKPDAIRRYHYLVFDLLMAIRNELVRVSDKVGHEGKSSIKVRALKKLASDLYSDLDGTQFYTLRNLLDSVASRCLEPISTSMADEIGPSLKVLGYLSRDLLNEKAKEVVADIVDPVVALRLMPLIARIAKRQLAPRASRAGEQSALRTFIYNNIDDETLEKAILGFESHGEEHFHFLLPQFVEGLRQSQIGFSILETDVANEDTRDTLRHLISLALEELKAVHARRSTRVTRRWTKSISRSITAITRSLSRAALY